MYSSHTKTTASLLILQISAYAVTSPRNGYSSRSFFLPEHGNINAEQTSSMSSSSSLARQESQQKNKRVQCQLCNRNPPNTQNSQRNKLQTKELPQTNRYPRTRPERVASRHPLSTQRKQTISLPLNRRILNDTKIRRKNGKRRLSRQPTEITSIPPMPEGS